MAHQITYTDNTKLFNAALGKYIIDIHINNNLFADTFTGRKVKHIKLPLYSPWVGSVWEHMIKIIKISLFQN